jgi:hypothetical protein
MFKNWVMIIDKLFVSVGRVLIRGFVDSGQQGLRQ